jgi:hypothetical protein
VRGYFELGNRKKINIKHFHLCKCVNIDVFSTLEKSVNVTSRKTQRQNFSENLCGDQWNHYFGTFRKNTQNQVDIISWVIPAKYKALPFLFHWCWRLTIDARVRRTSISVHIRICLEKCVAEKQALSDDRNAAYCCFHSHSEDVKPF